MQQAAQTRIPAVAGKFYPDNPVELERYVDALLSSSEGVTRPSSQKPRAMILPHAGYPFSGEAAARGYALIRPFSEQIRHVVLLGPSHFVDFQGMAVPSVASFTSPLGAVSINGQMRSAAQRHPKVITDDTAHAREHSLEVHLPFLQQTLEGFDLLPVAVGRTSPESCGQLLESLWDDSTIIIVSSDLSHFYADEPARKLDQQATKAIEKLDYAALETHHACGIVPIRGLLWLASRHNLQAATIALCNSADVTGDHSSVVGYGSYVFH